MLKKGLTFPLLFVWCAFHLLTPFAAVCSTGCRGITAAPVATPTSHACCFKTLKPRTEIKSSLACVCPLVLRNPARLETDVVLSPLQEKDNIQPLAFGSSTLLLSTKIADFCFSPPGLQPLDHPDCSGIHSILRI
jgi:hypothetical protein